MSTSDDFSQRLLQLNRILAQAHTTSFGGEGDPVSLHLGAVPTDRIRELTSVLARLSGGDNDAIDALAVRLLLNDYTSAVRHLRAVARTAAARIDNAAIPVREARLFMNRDLRREERLRMKRAQQAAGPPAPHA